PLLVFSFMSTMLLSNHAAELFHGLALSLFLRQLANVDFRNVALNGRRYEFLAGFVGLPCLRHRSAHGQHSRQANGQHDNFSHHSSTSSSVPPVAFSEGKTAGA